MSSSPSVRDEIEVSVVMPCLNEEDTVAICVTAARRALDEADIQGEVVVADNGSTDGSPQLAAGAGARVVVVKDKGYGAALMGGIEGARGRFVVMGDADGSYDFSEIPTFVEKLRGGCDLVQGCRLPSGGGRVLPGAMPALHYWLGNPLFSVLARVLFESPVRDIYCGLRAFRKDFQFSLGQRCTGMEFAPEMVLKAALLKARIAEVPITLHPDGRRSHAPHLRTVRDGWRTLRLLLLYSPRWVFLLPGQLLIAFGILGYCVALPRLRIAGIAFDAHTLLVASLGLIVGTESLLLFIVTKAYAIREGLLPTDPRLQRFIAAVQLETGLLVGVAGSLLGAALLVTAINEWRLTGFGPLDYAHTMRRVIPGATLVVLGTQAAIFGLLGSLLSMQRR
jgi:glycosyltransferase involved in cell wall biosynthesis